MADRDAILRSEVAEGMECSVPRLRRGFIMDCCHWIQQEKPVQVNRLMLEFLADLSG